jgi:hypothetical protein
MKTPERKGKREKNRVLNKKTPPGGSLGGTSEAKAHTAQTAGEL